MMNTDSKKEEMSLEEFKQAIGKYWNKNLEELNPVYRKLVAESISKVSVKSRVVLKKIKLESMPKSSSLYRSMGNIVTYVIDSPNKLSLNSSRLLDLFGVENYNKLIQTILSVLEKIINPRFHF